MAFETSLGELLKEDTIDANKILHELLDYRNIDTKTHIADPITFAMLEAVIVEFDNMIFTLKGSKYKCPDTEKFLKTFVTQLKKFLVSWDRLGRKEITETLRANREEESGTRSLFQRLAGMGK